MKVYVVECGTYNERFVAGVYSSAESAMAAHTHGRAKWSRDEKYDDWDNGLDYDERVSVAPYEVM